MDSVIRNVHSASIIDDLTRLINSLPATIRSQLIAEIRSALAEFNNDFGERNLMAEPGTWIV